MKRRIFSWIATNRFPCVFGIFIFLVGTQFSFSQQEVVRETPADSAPTKDSDVENADLEKTPVNAFVGIWSVTSAQTTWNIAILPNGRCLLIYHGQGSFIGNWQWKEMPGGILIDSLPRFRFWAGRNPSEARVEIETLHPALTSKDIHEFPRSFFMRRRTQHPMPDALKYRKIPANWERAVLPTDWDQTTGR